MLRSPLELIFVLGWGFPPFSQFRFRFRLKVARWRHAPPHSDFHWIIPVDFYPFLTISIHFYPFLSISVHFCQSQWTISFHLEPSGGRWSGGQRCHIHRPQPIINILSFISLNIIFIHAVFLFQLTYIFNIDINIISNFC